MDEESLPRIFQVSSSAIRGESKELRIRIRGLLVPPDSRVTNRTGKPSVDASFQFFVGMTSRIDQAIPAAVTLRILTDRVHSAQINEKERKGQEGESRRADRTQFCNLRIAVSEHESDSRSSQALHSPCLFHYRRQVYRIHTWFFEYRAAQRQPYNQVMGEMRRGNPLALTVSP